MCVLSEGAEIIKQHYSYAHDQSEAIGDDDDQKLARNPGYRPSH